MRVPVLTYHAAHANGDTYDDNDGVALSEDLCIIQKMGLRVVPLSWVGEAARGNGRDLTGCVALSCDDGPDLDFLPCSTHADGPLWPSLMERLLTFRRQAGRTAQPHLHLTSFVIADPQARAEIAQGCLGGTMGLGHRWWSTAARLGFIAIGNHSLDHNHPCVHGEGPDGLARGRFDLTTDAQAQAQIADAQSLITKLVGGETPVQFAYPFGPAAPFLAEDWFPRHGEACGLQAAFSDGGEPVTEHHSRWNLPRFICGYHWKNPGELERILKDAVNT